MSGNTDSLSVVMATYQGARFLEEQLATIQAQTRKPDLLVISDDRSTDGTREIARLFKRRAPFSVVVREGPGTGLADNFWSAVEVADTDLVAWADQDDHWHPEKLSSCCQALDRSEASFVSHSATVVDDLRRSLGRQYPSYHQDRTYEPLMGDPLHVPSGFASVFRRSMLDSVVLDDLPCSHQTRLPVAHDQVTGLLSFAFGRRVQLEAPLAEYRQHSSNAAGAPTRSRRQQLRFALNLDGSELVDLARVASGYGEFIARCIPDVRGLRALTFFGHYAEMCESRAAVYSVPARLRRVEALYRSLRAGAYVDKERGGFGVMGLARDACCAAMRRSVRF